MKETWYQLEETLDMSKPIGYLDGDGDIMILLPHIKEGTGYKLCGYDWFNLHAGGWNSCVFYPNVALAIRNQLVQNIELEATMKG